MSPSLPPRVLPAPLVVDETGRWLVGDDVRLVDSDYLDDDWDSAESQVDVRNELLTNAQRHGLRLADLLQAMYRIAGALDRREWNADTLDTIADTVRSLGFPVRDVEEEDEAA